MNFDDLKSPEIQEKLKGVSSMEDLVALAREEGMELSDEQLEAISGGGKWLGKCWAYCPDHIPDEWE